MSHFEQYDHVLGEEFDDYEDRRRCFSCLRGSRTHRPRSAGPEDCVRTLRNADIFLIVLIIVGLAAAIVWLIYSSGYNNSNIVGCKNTKTKMQKPPLIKRLCHVVLPSKSKSIRRGRCQQYQQPRSKGCSKCSRDAILWTLPQIFGSRFILVTAIRDVSTINGPR